MKKVIIGGVVGMVSVAYVMPTYAQNENASIERPKDDSDVRLALTKINLYSETNQINKAFALMDDLKVKYPSNPQVMMAAADLNLKIDNAGSAFEYINQAHKLDPLDEDILDRKLSALQDRSPFVSLGSTLKRTNQAREVITVASAKAFIAPTISAGVTVENDDVDSKGNIIRANGAAEEFNSSRQRGSLMAGKLFSNGNSANAKLHLGNETVGGGAEINILDRWGGTSINVNLYKPEWEFIELVVGSGSKDNVAISRRLRITNNWETNLEAGLNRYNLEDYSDVAKSRALDFSLSYNYPYLIKGDQKNEINFGASYNLGGEYFYNREFRINSLGELYNPFPAVTYEVHSFTLSVSKNFTDTISADAFGGYAKDRFGSSGALYGAGVAYTPNQNISFELLGSSGTLGERRVGKVDQYSVNVKLKW